jgi:hypothetical protein
VGALAPTWFELCLRVYDLPTGIKIMIWRSIKPVVEVCDEI